MCCVVVLVGHMVDGGFTPATKVASAYFQVAPNWVVNLLQQHCAILWDALTCCGILINLAWNHVLFCLIALWHCHLCMCSSRQCSQTMELDFLLAGNPDAP